MLQEERAERIAYDVSKDVAQITTGLHAEPATRAPANVDLLLDKDGFLVGVDLGGDGLARVVVMLGPHEAVARTESARIEVVRDGSARIAELTISGAGATIRAASKNPYL